MKSWALTMVALMATDLAPLRPLLTVVKLERPKSGQKLKLTVI